MLSVTPDELFTNQNLFPGGEGVITYAEHKYLLFLVALVMRTVSH